MPDPIPYVDRLKKGIERIDTDPPQGPDAEAMPSLRKSLARTIMRLAAGAAAPPATFRYQVTGGKAILFQGLEALPVEPARVLQILNVIGVEVQPGESLDLDGGLVGWIVRPEVNLIDTNVRAADATLQQLKRKTGHDRDHAAAQQAESTKIRLRSRMTLLVAALQAAQQDEQNAPVLPDVANLQVSAGPATPTPPPPAPEAKPAADPSKGSTTVRRLKELPPTPEMVADALWKILEAIDGTGFSVAAIGEVGYQAWDPARQATKIELLVSSTASQRETLLAAAKAHGFQPSPAGRPLSLRWIVDSEPGRAAPVELIEAANNPYLKQVLARAQPREVMQGQFPVVSCEDLVVMFAGSDKSDDRDSVIGLLQANISSIDAAYLRKEAQTAGVFEELKEAWSKAKQQAAQEGS
jgi:hypothetical protein